MPNVLRLQQTAKENCERISSGFQLSHFVSDKDYGTEALDIKNFKDEKFVIDNLLRLAERAAYTSQQTYLSLTIADLENLENSSSKALELLLRMRSFHQSQPQEEEYQNNSGEIVNLTIVNLKTDKQNLTKPLYEIYEKFSSVIQKLIVWTTPAEIIRQNQAFKDAEVGLQNQINALTTRLDTQNTISPHAKSFDDYARSHKWASRAWLLVGMLLLGGLFYYSHTYIYVEIDEAIKNLTSVGDQSKKISTDLFWGLILFRTFTIGLWGSFAFWAFKNYKINKHNELLNRVKAASLRTFKDFSETTHQSDKVHNLVIRKIADAIFDTARFGYLKDDNLPALSPTQLIQTILQTKKDD